MSTKEASAGLFCKTFAPDFDHLQLLLDSFDRHNPDALKLTVSLPAADLPAFRSRFGEQRANISLVADESYTDSEMIGLRGWHAQQICKLRSSHAVEADHYAVIDSDCYLVKDIRAADLLPRHGLQHSLCGSHLRTVMTDGNSALLDYLKGSLSVDASFFPSDVGRHATECLSSYVHYKDLDLDAPSALERSDIPFKVFGARTWYFYQPGQIFSRNLLKGMSAFFTERGITFRDAILISPWEYNWYGEYATYSSRDVIDYRVSPFLHFADESGLAFAKRNGITTDVIADKFTIVQMAARHLERVSLDF